MEFKRFIGIDYSGAATPVTRLPGLRAYVAYPGEEPIEAGPADGPLELTSAAPSRQLARGARNRGALGGTRPPQRWSRQALAHWLLERLREPVATFVGIDHGCGFPLRYLETHHLPRDWDAFLDDFVAHWPTDQPTARVRDVRQGVVGSGALRRGDARWRRLTEVRCGRAKSVFHFDVQGAVATSTHAGLPWLRWLRHQLGATLHIWPFDGWDVPAGCSVLAEAYPAKMRSEPVPAGRTPDQHDARSVATWLATEHAAGRLLGWMHPELDAPSDATARLEGWILGVR